MATTLVVTNDFPPRIGGIERFVAQVCGFCDDDVVVLTTEEPYGRGSGGRPADAGRPYEIVRRGRVLLPTPRTAQVSADLLRRTGATRVVFGAAAPLGLLAPALRRAGAERIVALSHGHETWWAQLPGTRGLLRRIGREVDALTTISAYTAGVIEPILDPADRGKLSRLAPPVDTEFFRPPDATPETGRPPRAIAVGRLVRRKGIDTLLRAWAVVRETRPDAELIVVGDGPERQRLSRLAGALGVGRAVWFTGGLDPIGVRNELWRADVFALPMRVQLGGLDTEGLGLAALEAAACGLPVVVSASGGAPETVLPGTSGFVVPPDSPPALAGRLMELLADPARGRAMGAAGRTHVCGSFGAAGARDRLRTLLDLA